jgi:ATPase subunit of ABC transporter with duplicated ATPase domains
MAKPDAPPPTPEQLFAEYHALRADRAATREAYDALAKKTRAAKASWTKVGDQARRQQLADLQSYITRFKPVEASRLLTRESLEREVASLRAAFKTRRGVDLQGAVRALWRRLEDTRGQLSTNPDYDEDHDDFVDSEGELMDLAQELGIHLATD